MIYLVTILSNSVTSPAELIIVGAYNDRTKAETVFEKTVNDVMKAMKEVYGELVFVERKDDEVVIGYEMGAEYNDKAVSIREVNVE